MDAPQRPFSDGLNELEAIIDRLLYCKFSDAPELWAIQLDLAKFQIATVRRRTDLVDQHRRQLELATECAQNRSEGWKAEAQRFQHLAEGVRENITCEETLYHLAKRFGDALAWLFLGKDGHFVKPLTHNNPNPPIPTGHSLRGMLAAAELLYRAKVGFPLIHDITNVLRIGDLTFVHPGQSPVTVEVKTRVNGTLGDLTHATLEISVAGDAHENEALVTKLDALGSSADLPVAPDESHELIRRDKKSARQLERMKRAKALQMGEPHIEIDGRPHLHVEVTSSRQLRNWDIVERVLRSAKESGYASAAAQGAIFYYAVHIGGSLFAPAAERPDLKLLTPEMVGPDLRASGIFFEDPNLNMPWPVSAIDHLSEDPPLDALPLHLHPYDADLVIDLVCGRMLLMVITNLGRVVEALKAAGLRARLGQRSRDDMGAWLVIEKPMKTPHGQVVIGRYFERGHTLRLVPYECLSLEGYVDTVLAMFKALTKKAGLIEDDDLLISPAKE